jgi:2-(1,2-epoxy-1,2-dihydrophenyl)acetyl-CoA isomerase
MSDVIREQRGNGVTVLTLNRPDSLNAMGGDLMPLLSQYLAEAAADRKVRCVVLTGAGRAFCAGGDVKGMAAGRNILNNNATENGDRSPASMLYASVEGLRASQRATSLMLHSMPKPTIAALNGHAVGAGLSLALACDIRIASENAKLGTAFRNVGFSGDFGGSWLLQRLVGTGKAKELYLGGDILKADEAHRIGMVNKVVPHDDLMKETLVLADHLAAGPALAYARMKENINRGATIDFASALDMEAMNMQLSGMTQDHQEAAKAFVEKRQPVFRGV